MTDGQSDSDRRGAVGVFVYADVWSLGVAPLGRRALQQIPGGRFFSFFLILSS